MLARLRKTFYENELVGYLSKEHNNQIVEYTWIIKEVKTKKDSPRFRLTLEGNNKTFKVISVGFTSTINDSITDFPMSVVEEIIRNISEKLPNIKFYYSVENLADSNSLVLQES